MAVFLLVMAVTILSTLWNGRGSRRTCGAPTRGVSLGILVGAAGSLVLWNFEAVLASIGSLVSSTLA